MKILILEDEKYFCNLIKKILIQKVPNAVTFISYTINEATQILDNYDLAIIDISLPDGDGIDFIKTYNDKFECILFVTSMENRILDAFGKNVIGFIAKSSILDLLPKKIDEFIKMTQNNTLCIDTKNGFFNIALKNIILIQTEQRKIKIHTTENDFILKRQSIKEFYKQLDNRFTWINQSTIINLDQVISWKKEEIHLNGNIATYASRNFLKNALTAFMERNNL